MSIRHIFKIDATTAVITRYLGTTAVEASLTTTFTSRDKVPIGVQFFEGATDITTDLLESGAAELRVGLRRYTGVGQPLAQTTTYTIVDGVAETILDLNTEEMATYMDALADAQTTKSAYIEFEVTSADGTQRQTIAQSTATLKCEVNMEDDEPPAAAAASAATAAAQATIATTQAGIATTKAGEAAASATAAATSATNAATSATAAAGSATAAAGSATTAANSATAAATSATNAANSATASATSATNSANSATSAATSATNAANSATAAASSATTATNQATAASTSATNAATSATNAANSATAAANSAASAAAITGCGSGNFAGTVALIGLTTLTAATTADLTLTGGNSGASLKLSKDAAGIAQFNGRAVVNYIAALNTTVLMAVANNSNSWQIGMTGASSANDFVVTNGGFGTLGTERARISLTTGALTVGQSSTAGRMVIDSLDATGNASFLTLSSSGSYKWHIKSASFTDNARFSIGKATSATTLSEWLGIDYSSGVVSVASGVLMIDGGSGSKELRVYNASNGGGLKLRLVNDSDTIDGLTILRSGTSASFTFNGAITASEITASDMIQAARWHPTAAAAINYSNFGYDTTNGLSIRGYNSNEGGSGNAGRVTLLTTDNLGNYVALYASGGSSPTITIPGTAQISSTVYIGGNLNPVNPLGDGTTNQGVTIGWNKSGGLGEASFIAAKGAGSRGGFRWSKWDGTTLTTLLDLDASGNATASGSLTSAAPSGGTAAAWKFGSKVAATTAHDTTGYVQVEIAGTAYKLALAV